MNDHGYGQFCPVAMASEVLCNRWTMLVMRELLCGSIRFNELRRGLPRISPALLSKRLSELGVAGLIRRETDNNDDNPVYRLTEAGEELRPVVMSLGRWGQRWLESQLSLKNLDPSLLMWDMRRNLNTAALPQRDLTIQFLYQGLASGQQARWWLVVDNAQGNGSPDLCMIDPGREIDLYVVSSLHTMTAIWMGITSVGEALREKKLTLTGDRELQSRMRHWLGLSPFAEEVKRVPS